jgi:hypothetical protein
MKTDNRPWYWIPFKLCLGPALRYNHLGFSYYVQNLGLTMKTSGYTRVYCTLGDKTIMESIYRLVRHQEKWF